MKKVVKMEKIPVNLIQIVFSIQSLDRAPFIVYRGRL
jgi:hypothetical protein